MARNAVTQRYLDEITRRGLGADELAAVAHSAYDLKPTCYRGQCLSRPAFVSTAERQTLELDLRQLHSALAAIPDRFFGGDLAAFARAAGMTDIQIAAVQRGPGDAPARVARGDMYHDGTAFRLMELNLGSSIGGFDNAVLNRLFLKHPFLAEFAAANHLDHGDPMRQLAELLRAEGQAQGAEQPLIGVVDWPESYQNLEAVFEHGCGLLADLGLETIHGHLGQLAFHHGRVWLHDRPIDAIYRIFLIEDLLAPEGPGLIDPVLGAAERGEVRIWTPMDIELYGSKAALTMLSDEANRDRLTAEELASLDRLLPWTRMVRDGQVTADGEQVDLMEYALAQREELVLKPTMMHGGIGVVLGWMVDQDQWRASVSAAIDGPYVLQRRIHAVPELVPTADGLTPHLFNWVVYLFPDGYGGAAVRGTSDLSGGVLSARHGAVLGCTFYERTP
ncbi:MAG: hypothetical protein ACM30G_14860, partial [Micromonosporaceae bacterium]